MKNDLLQSLFIDLFSRYSSDEVYNLQCWAEIEKAYSHKNRYYHNLSHLEKMFGELENIESEIDNLDCLKFAIFYHDIIYKATKKDNEYQSALFFKKRIKKTSFLFIDLCFEQIMATKEHQLSACNDTNIFIDLDLTILGQSWESYNLYFQNIRKEYKVYPDFLYNKGRKKALLHLMGEDNLFKTPSFINKYEEQARKNLAKEITFL